MYRRVRLFCLSFAFVAASCGDDATTPTDAGIVELPPRVTVSPDGTGYCCEPIRGLPCPALYHGGFSRRPDGCLGYTSDRAWSPSTREIVDEHGCTRLDWLTAMVCNQPDGGPDGAM